jgi:uncharacterized protein YacL
MKVFKNGFKSWLYNYNWMGFIIAAALTTFIAAYSYQKSLDWLGPFSAIGLLYIGYISENRILAVIMGAIGALPLAIATFYGALGPLTVVNMNHTQAAIIILVLVLIVGAVVGFVGAFFNDNRKKAIKQKAEEDKKKSNKDKKKEERKTNKNIKN